MYSASCEVARAASGDADAAKKKKKKKKATQAAVGLQIVDEDRTGFAAAPAAVPQRRAATAEADSGDEAEGQPPNICLDVQPVAIWLVSRQGQLLLCPHDQAACIK